MSRLALSIVGIVMWVTGAAAQTTIDRVIVQVNDEVILKSEYDQQRLGLRAELSAQFEGAQLERTLAEAELDLLRNLIDQSLLRQVGEQAGLRTDLEVIRTMEQMRQEYNFETLEELEAAIVQQGELIEEFKDRIRTQYLTQQVLQQQVYPKIVITTEDIREYYDSNITEFDRPEGVRLQEIVFSVEGMTSEGVAVVRERAEKALARVIDGEDFGSVAAEVSESTTASSSGDLGFFEKGSLREDYEAIASPLEPDEVSEIIEIPGELVILKLLDHHTGGLLSFELARGEIQNVIFGQNVEPAVRDYLTTLRVEGFVTVRDGYHDSGAVPE